MRRLAPFLFRVGAVITLFLAGVALATIASGLLGIH